MLRLRNSVTGDGVVVVVVVVVVAAAGSVVMVGIFVERIKADTDEVFTFVT